MHLSQAGGHPLLPTEGSSINPRNQICKRDPEVFCTVAGMSTSSPIHWLLLSLLPTRGRDGAQCANPCRNQGFRKCVPGTSSLSAT